MNKELREAVARAILKVWHVHPWELADPFHQDGSLREADAAISIIRPAVLEEAAKVASENYRWGRNAFDIASAIRSLAKEVE